MPRYVIFLFIAYCVIANVALAFYSSVPEVTQLSTATFKSIMSTDASIWVVEFYAPWCGHCKNLAPEYIKAAKALSGSGVKVGAVDATLPQNQQLAQQFHVEGFPTIKMFVNGAPTDYNGERTAKAMVEASLRALKNNVLSRLDGGSGSSYRSKADEHSSDEHLSESDSAVVHIKDEDQFDDLVLNGDENEMWMVEFFAPWCGHCKALAPEWESAAVKLHGTGIRLAAIDATALTTLASRFNVQGYPTIKVFPPKSFLKRQKRDSDGFDYSGERSANGIISFAEDSFVNKFKGEFKMAVTEIIDKTVLEQVCKPGKEKCVLMFVPDIYDTMKDGRLEYLKIFNGIQRTMKHLSFAWLEAGSQAELQNALNLAFGFPALVYIRNIQSHLVAFVYHGKFDTIGINSFLSSGKSPSQGIQLDGWPEIRSVTSWNFDEPPPLQSDDDFNIDDFLAED